MKMDYDEMVGEEITGIKHKEHDEHEHKEHKRHKLMKLEDVIEQLQEDFAEEIADSKKYLCMAKAVERAGHSEEACYYLTEMAKDEYTHANFIHSVMVKHDIELPEEQVKEYEELEEKMKEFFR